MGLHRLDISGVMPLPGWSSDWEVDSPIPVLTWAKYLEPDISSKVQPWGTDCYVEPGRAARFPLPCQSPWHRWTLVSLANSSSLWALYFSQKLRRPKHPGHPSPCSACWHFYQADLVTVLACAPCAYVEGTSGSLASRRRFPSEDKDSASSEPRE